MRSLILELEYYVLFDDEFRRLRTAEELEKEVMLKPSFGLQSLRELKFRVLVTEYRKNEVGGLESLREVVRRGFGEVGRSEAVRVEYEVSVLEH